MKRLFVLLAICVGLGAAFAVACGGNDKPPLTPDGENQLPPEANEAGAPPPASSSK